MKTLSRLLVVCFALGLGLPALAAPALADDGGYGYFRLVEGPAAQVQQAGTAADERAAAEINQPVLAGDHLWVPQRSKVEIVLADQNILRVDGRSELILERLAASPDRNDRATVIRLLAGNVQLIVSQDALGDELPRIETPNATVYPQHYGVYRITADEGWSQVVVRRGTAQVVTAAGSSRVKADEEVVIDDHDADRRADVGEAGAFDSLERWGRQLDDEYASADLPQVDDNLRYSAASLNRYGSWVEINGSSYWRPRVAADWRPYWQGRWIYTPAGLTWISSEPWGWVPYHYGSWDYAPGYGWVWQPGYVWSPAWVYWYWGPSYVGWCPTGYYTRYYGPELGVNVGFRWGVYGWAGGSWDLFDRWSFVSNSYFSYRDGYRQGYRDGYWDAHRDVRRYAVPVDRDHRDVRRDIERGIITTDTKPLKPSVWKDPSGPLRVLRGKTPADLPDVTQFIARKPNLPPAVARSVVADKPQTLDGTPLRPGSLGRPGRRPEGGRPSVFGGAPDRSGKPDTQGAPGAAVGERNPAAGKPQVRPGRPAPEADGGAPKPDRQPADRPSVFGGKPDRTERPATEERRPPVERERNVKPPPESKPAPESEGASPRRPVIQPRPDPQDRPEARENRRENPPERRPEVQERQRPPERKPEAEEKRPPERRKPANDEDKKPPQG